MATKSPVVFLQEVRTELSKVIWPTKEETIRLTTVVIGVSVAVALLVGGFDYLFTVFLNLIIR